MTNNQNDQRSGKRDENDTKSGGKSGGKSQGSKSGTGTTRAGEEKTSKSQQR